MYPNERETASEARDTQVSFALGRLEGLVERASNTMSRLEDRLSSVRQSRPEKAVGRDEVPEVSKVGLAQRIDTSSAGLEILCDRIDTLQRELEL